LETKMSLEKWAEYGWVRREPTSQNEIKSLMSIVDRDLKDAGVTAISEDRRFEAAFNAARTAANLALRACGYRTSTQVGHHLRTIESLEFTIQADARLIHRLDPDGHAFLPEDPRDPFRPLAAGRVIIQDQNHPEGTQALQPLLLEPAASHMPTARTPACSRVIVSGTPSQTQTVEPAGSPSRVSRLKRAGTGTAARLQYLGTSSRSGKRRPCSQPARPCMRKGNNSG
jgi:hypothetical protein